MLRTLPMFSHLYGCGACDYVTPDPAEVGEHRPPVL